MKSTRSRGRYADDEFEVRPRRRRKAKKGRAGLWVALLVVGVLVLAGGGAGAYFLFLHGRGAGDGKGGGAGTPRGDSLAEAGDRFLGTWQGTSREHPSLTLRLEVSPGKLVFRPTNVVTHETKTATFVWQPVRVSGNTLVIRRELEQPGTAREWSVEFTSDDAIHVKALPSGDTLGDYTRSARGSAGRRGTTPWPRRKAGWSASGRCRRCTTPGCTTRPSSSTPTAALASSSTTPRAATWRTGGAWKALEAKGDTLRIQVSGIEGFNQMNIEFLSDREVRYTLVGRGAGGGIGIPASRVS